MTFTIPEGEDGNHRLTLRFVTASGYEGTFGTLSIEEAIINLLSADAASGATPISFGMPQQSGRYTVYNLTGEKGPNYAVNGFAADATYVVTRTVSAEERWGSKRAYLIEKDDPWDAAAGDTKTGHGVGMS